MNVLLNIPDEIVGKYQFEAEKDKRSRKNLMEKVLIDYFEKPVVALQDLTKPNLEIKPPEQPKNNFEVRVEKPQLPNFDENFEEQIEAAKNYNELQKVVKKITSASLNWKRRNTLLALAETTQNKKGFYND